MYTPKTIRLHDRNGNRKYLNDDERSSYYKTTLKQKEQIKLFGLMLFWTGARISEVLNLKVSNIDLSDQVVVIESLKKRKKGMYRQVPLPSEFIVEITDHIQQNNLQPYNIIWNWSRRTASRYIHKIMVDAKIHGIQASPKGIRHSFAVHCITKNIPLPLIKKWMGHASISTTAIYLDIVGLEERKFAERIWTG